MRGCWRRSWRGRDQRVTRGLDLANGRLLNLSSVLGMFVLPAVPAVGAIFKDEALRE